MKKIIKKKISKIIRGCDKFLFKMFRGRLIHFFENELVNSISKNIIIVSPEKTLDEIENCILSSERGAYLRFGDGDVFLLKNKTDSFQVHSVSLSQEMKETFLVKGQNVFKCLAIHSDAFGYSEGMELGNHKNPDTFALRLFRDSYMYFIGNNIYSPVALHFIASFNAKRANYFLKILKNKTRIFVGNEETDLKTVSLLFGNNVSHIKTPVRNAYSEIDRVESEAIRAISEIDDFCVVCIAMGCSGRPLMKRLWNKNFNIFLFDFGSLLDGVSGNKTRAWLEINDVNYKELLNGLDEVT